MRSAKGWWRKGLGIVLGATPRATGTLPPVVTLSATDGGALSTVTATSVRVEITTTGIVGTAVFRAGFDDGLTWPVSGATVASTYDIGNNVRVNFPAGTYTNDDVYRATLNQWTNLSTLGSAADLIHATAANQLLALPAGPDGDGTSLWAAAAAASTFNFGHDGTNITGFWAGLPRDAGDGSIFATGCGAAANRGFMLSYDGGSQRLQFFLSDGAGYIFAASGANNSTTRNAAHVIAWRYSESHGTPKVQVWSDNTSVISGDPTGAPSASNAVAGLRLGTRNNGTNSLDGVTYEGGIFAASFSDREIQRTCRALARVHGISGVA